MQLTGTGSTPDATIGNTLAEAGKCYVSGRVESNDVDAA